MNASIYFWKRDTLIKKKGLFGKNVGIYLMPRDRSIDIDDYFDLELVKKLIKKKKNIKTKKFIDNFFFNMYNNLILILKLHNDIFYN